MGEKVLVAGPKRKLSVVTVIKHGARVRRHQSLPDGRRVDVWIAGRIVGLGIERRRPILVLNRLEPGASQCPLRSAWALRYLR
jgi:hypothetical protein